MHMINQNEIGIVAEKQSKNDRKLTEEAIDSAKKYGRVLMFTKVGKRLIKTTKRHHFLS